MKQLEKPFLFSLFLSCIPVLLYFLLYTQLPEQIPSSFDFSGAISGYTSRNIYFILTLLPLFITIILNYAPKMDPKKQNYYDFVPFYGKFQVFMVVFMDIIICLCMLQSVYDNVPTVNRVIPFLLGALFIFLGKFLPKTKQCFSFGIKTPWTLSSELVWNQTHRVGGYSFIFAGICSFLSALLPSRLTAYLLLFGIVVAVAVPSVMSYIYYKREKQS